jgi:uncharacterized damage-inducible protein DinB
VRKFPSLAGSSNWREVDVVTTAIGDRSSEAGVSVTASHGINRLLAEFDSLLRLMPPEAYYSVPQSGQAPIARHVGHCLDLIETLLSVGAGHVIAYQARGGVVGDLAASLGRIRELQNLGLSWPGRSLDGIICVEQAVWPLDLAERGWSTLGDELAFVVNHVVDRQKMIERSMNRFGFDVPKGFGSMQLQPLRARSSVPPAWELWRLLDELESLLTEVESNVYCARFATEVSGSIGEHVRHCLDHISALLAADPSTMLSYDRRQRGTTVETDAAEAVRQILRLKRGIEAWSTRSLDETIRVSSMISPSGAVVTGWSTLARELAFVVSHTIHHQAIIGVLLAIHGTAVPDRFGHSPSTPRRN